MEPAPVNHTTMYWRFSFCPALESLEVTPSFVNCVSNNPLFFASPRDDAPWAGHTPFRLSSNCTPHEYIRSSPSVPTVSADYNRLWNPVVSLPTRGTLLSALYTLCTTIRASRGASLFSDTPAIRLHCVFQDKTWCKLIRRAGRFDSNEVKPLPANFKIINFLCCKINCILFLFYNYLPYDLSILD